MLSEPVAPPDGRELGEEGLRWALMVVTAARRCPQGLTPTQRDFVGGDHAQGDPGAQARRPGHALGDQCPPAHGPPALRVGAAARPG
jgi:hypothetical protein